MEEYARFLGLAEEDVTQAYVVGLVHDIGKIGIPETILNKPSKLSKEEFDVIRKHPAIGADILAEISKFAQIAEIVRCHHENYDGSGYPSGLQGKAIPLMSRMMALCDSYDAMTTIRCYREPITPHKALEEIQRASGGQYDPELSRAFIDFMLSRLNSENVS